MSLPPLTLPQHDASLNASGDHAAHLQARIGNKLFTTFHSLDSRLFSRRPLKVLFSERPEWRIPLMAGFAKTHHEIHFGELSPEKFGDFDLVVPLTMRDLRFLDTVRQLVPQSGIPIPETRSIRFCDDKILFNETLSKNGYADLIPAMGGRLDYPYILKRRTDEWGANSRIIFDESQYEAHAKEIGDPDYFTQRFVNGRHEYATHILFKDCRIVCSLNIRYTFPTDTPIKGRDQSLYTAVCGCPYLETFASILKFIGFEGLCCVNYKVADGRPYLLEINPRFGGSLSPYFFRFLRHIS